MCENVDGPTTEKLMRLPAFSLRHILSVRRTCRKIPLFRSISGCKVAVSSCVHHGPLLVLLECIPSENKALTATRVSLQNAGSAGNGCHGGDFSGQVKVRPPAQGHRRTNANDGFGTPWSRSHGSRIF